MFFFQWVVDWSQHWETSRHRQILRIEKKTPPIVDFDEFEFKIIAPDHPPKITDSRKLPRIKFVNLPKHPVCWIFEENFWKRRFKCEKFWKKVRCYESLGWVRCLKSKVSGFLCLNTKIGSKCEKGRFFYSIFWNPEENFENWGFKIWEIVERLEHEWCKNIR